MKKAVVLLSGGLDSTTCLYWARSVGFHPLALLFDYGQKHKKELTQAILIAEKSKIPYHVIQFSLPWGGSALVDQKTQIPHGRNLSRITSGGIPPTYVPARNTIFLSFALSYADAVDAEAVIIGANAVDFSGYPDCRLPYIRAMQKVALEGTRRGHDGKRIKIIAPLIRMTKEEIIQLGQELHVPYELTWSCYAGGAVPCGKCDSCLLRKKGFSIAGCSDPALK